MESAICIFNILETILYVGAGVNDRKNPLFFQKQQKKCFFGKRCFFSFLFCHFPEKNIRLIFCRSHLHHRDITIFNNENSTLHYKKGPPGFWSVGICSGMKPYMKIVPGHSQHATRLLLLSIYFWQRIIAQKSGENRISVI